jgi:tRNA A-37 threonylcarbamoyl transferase component Bud32
MTTIPSNTCPQCGALIPEDSAHGLCPRCVFAKALAPTADGGFAHYVPPSLESVCAAFSHLEVTGLIGSGGMGAVFKARQPQLDRFVALKILPAELASQPGFSERFQREAQALARLSHPHIVTVHDFGQAGGFYYLLMEFIDGVNLRQLLQTKRLTPKEALSIVPPICEALQCAHDHGIVHRDIKPENLLIDKAGVVKLADFGIAKMYSSPLAPREENSADADMNAPGAAETDLSRESPQFTSRSQMATMGTPDYAAPEQASGTADHRADIYSLGVVLYEMLTGERPTAKLEAPSKRVQVDIRIDEIVLRALEKSPELRFATAAEFCTQVEAAVEKNTSPETVRRTSEASVDFGAPWGGDVKALTILAAGILGYYLLSFYRHHGQLSGSRVLVWLVLPLFLLVLGWVMMVTSYSVDADGIVISRPLWRRRIRRNSIVELFRLPLITPRHIGLFGIWGFCGKSGLAWSGSLGFHWVAASQGTNRIVIKRHQGLPVVISPSDAEAFIRVFEARIGQGAGRAGPVFPTAAEFRAQVEAVTTNIEKSKIPTSGQGHPTAGYFALICGGMSALIPTIFYWLAPWALPWLSLEAQEFMLKLTLVFAVLAIVLGSASRKSQPGHKGLIMGGISLTIWLLFFIAGQLSIGVESDQQKGGSEPRDEQRDPTFKESRIALKYMDATLALNRIKAEHPELANGVRHIETDGISMVLDAASPSFEPLQKFLALIDQPPEPITLEGTMTESLPNSPAGSGRVISKPAVQTLLGTPAVIRMMGKDGAQIEFSITADRQTKDKSGAAAAPQSNATMGGEMFVLKGMVTESARDAPAGPKIVFPLPTLQAPLGGSVTFTHRLHDGRDVELSLKLTHEKLKLSPYMKQQMEQQPAAVATPEHSQPPKESASTEPAKPATSASTPKTEQQPNEIPFKGAPKLRYIAWMPKDEGGWQLFTPSGEAVTAPGDIPVADWEGWKTGLLNGGQASKISDTAGWLMFFYSHPAIDERSESEMKLLTLAGAEIPVNQRVSVARAPKTPQADGWLATGCRVPYADVRGSLKVRLMLTAGSWQTRKPALVGKTNNSGGGGLFLSNSGEDVNHRAFVTVNTLDDDKHPLPQWEVLGRLSDGSDVRNAGSTAVYFQGQFVHTISFGKPLASYAGFILRSRARKAFTNDVVQVPPVLVATPESGAKSTFQMRWVQDKPSADNEPMTLAGRGQSETLNVEKAVLLDQSALHSVEAIHRPQGDGGECISLQFTESGKQRFAKVTRDGKGRRLAIIIDGQVRAAPTIQDEVSDGRVEISGNMTYEEADDLAARLQQAIKSTAAVESSKKEPQTDTKKNAPSAQADSEWTFGPTKEHALSCAAGGIAPYFQFADEKTVPIRLASAASPEEIKEDWEKAEATGGVDFSLSDEAGDILIHPHGCAFGVWITGNQSLFMSMSASSAMAQVGELTATKDVISLTRGQWPVSCTFRTSRGAVGWLSISSVNQAEGRPMSVRFEYQLVKRFAGLPQTVNEFFQKANALWNQGDFEGAVRVYDEAIKLHPNVTGFFNNRANCHAALKQYDKALADYGQAMRLDPSNGNFHRARSLAYFQMGDYDHAIADLDIAVKADPEGVHFDLRGRAYHAKGDFRAALADYEKGAQATPGFTLTFLDLAWLLATCPDDSIRDGQKASQYADLAAGVLHGDRPEVSVALAAAHAEQREYAEAIRLEQKFLKTLSPNSDEADQSKERLQLYQAHQPLRSPMPISRSMWR